MREADEGDELRAVDVTAARLNLGLPNLTVATPPAGRTLLYDARVTFSGRDGEAEVACVGPVPYGRTLLHDVLGAENIVRVTFVDAERRRAEESARVEREKEALIEGLTIGGFVHLGELFCSSRRIVSPIPGGSLFKMFAFRDDNPGSYVFIRTPGVSADGALRWGSVSEARALLDELRT